MLLANFRANLRDLARAAVDEIFAHLPGAAPVIDETPRALCLVPGRPHTATDGRLCRDHFEELSKWLHEIETEAKRLDAAPSMSTRLGQSGGGTLASQQSPVVLAAVVYTDRRSVPDRYLYGPACARCRHTTCESIRDEHGTERLVSVYAVLHRWAQRTRDEHMLGVPVEKILVRVPPGHEGPFVVDTAGTIGATTLIPQQLTIATERNVLTRQLDWIAGRDWIPEMREDIRRIRNALLKHNRNEDDKPLTGWCYKPADDSGTECGGNLWPVYAEYESEPDDGPLQPREVVCDRNPAHRWTGGRGGDLARLSLILERQQREAADHGVTEAGAPVPVPRLTVVPDDGLTAPDRLRGVLDEQLADEQRPELRVVPVDRRRGRETNRATLDTPPTSNEGIPHR